MKVTRVSQAAFKSSCWRQGVKYDPQKVYGARVSSGSLCNNLPLPLLQRPFGGTQWELAAGARSVAWFGGPEVCGDTVVQQQPSRLQNLAADTFYFPVDVTLRDHTGD